MAASVPALADDAAIDGTWTGAATLSDRLEETHEAEFTLLRAGEVGAFDIRLPATPPVTCRYVFRAGARPEIALQARQATALEPRCAKDAGLSWDPGAGTIRLDLDGQTIDVKLHHRFKAPDDALADPEFAFDILDLAPGLGAELAIARLEVAGFAQAGSRVLSGPGWREEHVIYQRALDGGQQDQLRIVFSPEIEGADNARRLVYIERFWHIAGQHTISDIERSVAEKYGLSLVRVGDAFAQDRHTTRTGEEIDLSVWKAGCADTALQQIPFLKAFSATPETALVSTSCGRALTAVARPVAPGGSELASFSIALLDVDLIWRATWQKWLATTRRDVEAALGAISTERKPVKL